jgi:hypothetical protein
MPLDAAAVKRLEFADPDQPWPADAPVPYASFVRAGDFEALAIEHAELARENSSLRARLATCENANAVAGAKIASIIAELRESNRGRD